MQKVHGRFVAIPAYRQGHQVASIACIYLISGSFSLPLLGSFHLSLTVLVHYQSLKRILT